MSLCIYILQCSYILLLLSNYSFINAQISSNNTKKIIQSMFIEVPPFSICPSRITLTNSNDFEPCTYNQRTSMLMCSALKWCSFPDIQNEDPGKEIKILIISYNQIPYLDGNELSIPALQQLRQFIIENNNVSSFYLKNTLQLPELRIFRLTLLNEKTLEEVKTWPQSDIVKFFSGAPQLRTLEIKNVNADVLDGTFALPLLETLSLRSVPLSRITESVFNNVRSLSRLEFQNVGPSLFQLSDTFHWDMSLQQAVQAINLTENQLTAIPKKFLSLFTNAKELYLSGNEIKQIQKFDFPEQFANKLELLDFEGNEHLSTESVAGLSSLISLKTLSLRRCHSIKDVPLELKHLVGLENLFLDETEMEKLSLNNFSPLGKLKILTLENMASKTFAVDWNTLDDSLKGLNILRISGIDVTKTYFTGGGSWLQLFQSMSQLEVLYLRNGNVRSEFLVQNIPAMPNLKEMVLVSNSLEWLPRNISILWPSIQTLILSYNPLQSFPLELIDEWKQLKKIRLDFTSISTLSNCSTKLWTFPNMLTLRKTPLICDCRIAWLQQMWLNQSDGEESNLKDILCSSSGPHANEPFLHVSLYQECLKEDLSALPNCSYLFEKRDTVELVKILHHTNINSTHIEIIIQTDSIATTLSTSYYFQLSFVPNSLRGKVLRNSNVFSLTQTSNLLDLRSIFGIENDYVNVDITVCPVVILINTSIILSNKQCISLTIFSTKEPLLGGLDPFWLAIIIAGSISAVFAIVMVCICTRLRKKRRSFSNCNFQGIEEYSNEFRMSNVDVMMNRDSSLQKTWSASLQTNGHYPYTQSLAGQTQVFRRKSSEVRQSNSWEPMGQNLQTQHIPTASHSMDNLLDRNGSSLLLSSSCLPPQGSATMVRRYEARDTSTLRRINRRAQSSENLRRSRVSRTKSEIDAMVPMMDDLQLRTSALSLTSVHSQSVDERGPLPQPPTEDPYEEIQSPHLNVPFQSPYEYVECNVPAAPPPPLERRLKPRISNFTSTLNTEPYRLSPQATHYV